MPVDSPINRRRGSARPAKFERVRARGRGSTGARERERGSKGEIFAVISSAAFPASTRSAAAMPRHNWE